MTIESLVSRILAAREAYYNDVPLMDDRSYDLLEDEFRKLAPEHPLLKQIGAPAPSDSGWPKVKHGQRMSSLNKAQTIEEFNTWWASCGKPTLFVTEKLDGISCFDGDTPVHLANGETITIREIVEKQIHPQILSWDGEKIVTRQVVAGYDNGLRQNWVRLTMEDGTTIVVTEDHNFYVPDEGWLKASELAGKNILHHIERET